MTTTCLYNIVYNYSAVVGIYTVMRWYEVKDSLSKLIFVTVK